MVTSCGELFARGVGRYLLIIRANGHATRDSLLVPHLALIDRRYVLAEGVIRVAVIGKQVKLNVLELIQRGDALEVHEIGAALAGSQVRIIPGLGQHAVDGGVSGLCIERDVYARVVRDRDDIARLAGAFRCLLDDRCGDDVIVGDDDGRVDGNRDGLIGSARRVFRPKAAG